MIRQQTGRGQRCDNGFEVDHIPITTAVTVSSQRWQIPLQAGGACRLRMCDGHAGRILVGCIAFGIG